MVPLPWWRKTSPPHAHMTGLLLLLLMMMFIIIIIIITNIFCIIIDIHHHHHDDECYYCCDSFKLLSEESPIMIHSDVAVPSLPAFETYRGPSAMIPPKTCCKPSFISFIWHTSTCPLCSGWLRLTYFNWNLWKESQTCTILQCSLGKLLINHVFFFGPIPNVDAKNHPHHPRGAAVSQRIPIEVLKPGGSMAAPCDWIIGRSGKIWDNSGRCGRYIIDIIHYLWFMGNIWDNTNKNEGDSLLLIYNGICNQRLWLVILCRCFSSDKKEWKGGGRIAEYLISAGVSVGFEAEDW